MVIPNRKSNELDSIAANESSQDIDTDQGKSAAQIMQPANQPVSLWIILFFSLAAFVGCLLLVVPKSVIPPQGPDFSKFYSPVACNLLAGRGLTTEDGSPAMQFPVGYPMFIAAVYGTADAIGTQRLLLLVTANVLLHAGTATLLAIFASKVWTSRWLFLMPAVLWICYPMALFIVSVPASESVYTPLMVGAVLCFWNSFHGNNFRYSRLLLSGILIGLAGLCRPAILPVPIMLSFVLLVRPRGIGLQKRLAAICVLLLSAVIVVTPWEVWMYKHSGKILPLSDRGYGRILCGFVWAHKDDPLRVALSVPPDVQEFCNDVVAEAEKNNLSNLSQLSHWLAKQAIDRPATCLKVLGYKAIRSWYGTDSHRREGISLLVQVPLLALSLVAIFRGWRSGGLQRELVVLACAIVLGAWLTTMMMLSIVRLIAPTMSFLFMLTPGAIKPGDVHD